MTLKNMRFQICNLRRDYLFDESERDTQLTGEAEQYFLLAINALDNAERYFALADMKNVDKPNGNG